MKVMNISNRTLRLGEVFVEPNEIVSLPPGNYQRFIENDFIQVIEENDDEFVILENKLEEEKFEEVAPKKEVKKKGKVSSKKKVKKTEEDS